MAVCLAALPSIAGRIGVRFGSFGDIGATLVEVRFVPITTPRHNLLSAISRHSAADIGRTGLWGGKTMMFDLTPRKVRFIISVAISVVLTLIAIVIQYVHITGGATHGGFEILLVGYLVLLAGSLLRGV